MESFATAIVAKFSNLDVCKGHEYAYERHATIANITVNHYHDHWNKDKIQHPHKP